MLRETAAVSAPALCIPYNHAPRCVVLRKAVYRVPVCLSVPCRLRFWQNDRHLLCATAERQEWKGHRNNSQHRKLTLQKKILPPLLPGLEPATFRSRVGGAVPMSYPRKESMFFSSQRQRLFSCTPTIPIFHAQVETVPMCSDMKLPCCTVT